MSWGHCSVSSFLVKFLKPRHPTFTPSLPWAAGIHTQGRQCTNRTNRTRQLPTRKLCRNGIIWPNFSLPHLLLSSLPFPRGHWSHQHVTSLQENHPCQMPGIAPSCSTFAGSQKSLPTPHSCSAALSTLHPSCRGGLVAEIRLPLPGLPVCFLLWHCSSTVFPCMSSLHLPENSPVCWKDSQKCHLQLQCLHAS